MDTKPSRILNKLAQIVIQKNYAWIIISISVVIAGLGLYQTRYLTNEDNLLAFLPNSNPDVQLFNEINQKFGGLELALVGIPNDNIFTAEFLKRLQRTTIELNQIPEISHALSLTNIIDYTADHEAGGVVTSNLIQDLPQTPEEEQALREKVLSRAHVVGNLISADGKAIQIYNYLTFKADPKTVAKTIKDIVKTHFPSQDIYWGGNPFISTYIYNTTQKDLHGLSPWAVLAIILIMIFSFRDLIGAALVFLTTAMGIAISLGAMAALHIPFNILLSAMPVVLFAIGSAFGTHMISRYYSIAEKSDLKTALYETVSHLSPIVITAGLTTIAGIGSFVFMDIPPMKTFGIFTALGILSSLILSITFIPAVICVTQMQRKTTHSMFMRTSMIRLAIYARKHSFIMGTGLGLLVIIGSMFVMQVNVSIDNTTFFSEGSPPDKADAFLKQYFGGAQFIQVFIKGDMEDPHTLREIQRIADRIATEEHVSAVTHVGLPLSLSNSAMAGFSRIPDTKPQVQLLYSFLAGDPTVAQLTNQKHDQGLLHIKIDTNKAEKIEWILSRIEDIIKSEAINHFQIKPHVLVTNSLTPQRSRIVDLITWRLLSILKQSQLPVNAKVKDILHASLVNAPHTMAANVFKTNLSQYLLSEESPVDLKSLSGHQQIADNISQEIYAHYPDITEDNLLAIFKQYFPKHTDGTLLEDLAYAIVTPIEEIARLAKATATSQTLTKKLGHLFGSLSHNEQKAVTTALIGFSNPTALIETDQPHASHHVEYFVNGLPVMHRGLSQSVVRNQWRSLGFALLFVVLILSVAFRSIRAGLLITAPTMLSLLVIYGTMGFFKVHLDIGTSMLASIIIGMGVDYAVHFASAWNTNRDQPLLMAAANAANRTGPAIWTNAIMIAAGFFVLTLGDARPLQNVGGLTTVAMLVAALTTFIVIPLFAQKRQYHASSETLEQYEYSPIVKTIFEESTTL